MRPRNWNLLAFLLGVLFFGSLPLAFLAQPVLEDPVKYDIELFADLSNFGRAKVFQLTISSGENGFPAGMYITSGPAGDDRSDRLFHLDATGQVTVIAESFLSNESMIFARGNYGEGMLVTEPLTQRILRVMPDGSKSVFSTIGTAPFGPAVLAYDENGVLYVSDFTGGKILRVETDGSFSTFANLPLPDPQGCLSVGVKPILPLAGGGMISAIFTLCETPTGLGKLYSISPDGQSSEVLAEGLDGVEILSRGPGGAFRNDIFIPTIGGHDIIEDGAVYLMDADGHMKPFLTHIDAVSVAFDEEGIFGGGMFVADLNESGGAGRIWRVTVAQPKPILADPDKFEIELFADFKDFGDPRPKAFQLLISEFRNGFPQGLLVTSGPLGDERSDRLFYVDTQGQVSIFSYGFISNETMVFAKGNYGEGLLVTEPLTRSIIRVFSDGSKSIFATSVGTPPFGPAQLSYDQNGLLFVTDFTGGRILLLNTDGTFFPYAVIPLPDPGDCMITGLKAVNAATSAGMLSSTFTLCPAPTGIGQIFLVSPGGEIVVPIASGLNGVELLTEGPGGMFGSDLYIASIGGPANTDGAVLTLSPTGEIKEFLTNIDAVSVVFDVNNKLGGGMFVSDLNDGGGYGRIWHVTQKTVAVKEREAKEAVALQCIPNPVQEQASLHFELPGSGRVVLEVLDIHGNVISELLNTRLPAGKHQVVWRPDRAKTAAGIYFCRLKAGASSQALKVVLL